MLNGPKSFLLNLWNAFDFILFIITLLGILDGQFDFTVYNLKSLRAIRMLRIIKYFEDLQLSMQTLFVSTPEILKLLLFYFIFLVFFGLAGVKYFKGAYHYCETYNIDFMKFIVTNTDCYDYGGDWLNRDVNFDSIIAGISSLFQIATTEGWLYLM